MFDILQRKTYLRVNIVKMNSGKNPQRTSIQSAGQSARSIPISQIGRVPRSRSRTAIRRSTRSVSVPVADAHNLEHYIFIPPDGGYGWIIVTVAFVANFLIDGVSYTFGIFLSELSAEFKVHPTQVALITSYMGGFYYLTGPIACALCNRFGFRFVGLIGGITSAGLFTVASFSHDFFVFTILMGVCTGMAFNFIYTPALLVVGFYFESYRALATSISVTGTSFGIMVFPIIFENSSLLGQFDWRWKFRIISGSFLFLSFLVLAFRPIPPTKLLEQTAFKLERDSSGSLQMERNESRLTATSTGVIKRIFDQYHNAVFPTVAEYAATMEQQHPRTKLDEPFTFLAILPELSGSGSIYRASADTSIYLDELSLMSSYQTQGFWKDLFACCIGGFRKEKLGCKVTPPYPSTRCCTSKCCHSKYCVQCRNFCWTAPEMNRPMYRDDILFQGSLATMPEYTFARSRITIPVDVPDPFSRISRNISYHMSVSRVISHRDVAQQKKCVCCPESVIRVLITMIDIRLFKSIAFCLLTTSGFLTMMGLYVPFLLIVERARELKLKEPWPTQLLTVMGVANMLGRILCGGSSITPDINPMVVTYMTLTLGGLAVLLSSFARSLMSYVIMAITFGTCVASFSTLRTVLLVNIVGLENLTNGFGITILFYGLALLVGIPLSIFLQTTYGTYKYCFMLAGISITLSGLILTPVDRINRYERNKRRPKVSFDM